MAGYRKLSWKFSAFLGVLIVTGCAHQVVERAAPEPEPATADSSFESFRDRMIDGVPLAEYLEARVFRLTGNVVPMRSDGPGGTLIGLEVVDGTKGHGFGWAVPLTADGYFLTAAHILDKAPEPFYLMNWKSGKVAASPIRVVWDAWVGIDREELDVLIPADFAIVHMPLESGDYAEWAWDWELRGGIEMVAPGGTDFWPPHMSAGQLLSVAPGVKGYGTIGNLDTVGTLVLWHDVHHGYGDSGAPVFLPSGRLVAMTIGGGTRGVMRSTAVNGDDEGSEERVPVAVAVRPDPDSLAQIIRRDRVRMAADGGEPKPPGEEAPREAP